MVEEGVPKGVAQQATGELVSRISVGVHPSNYLHDVEVAKKLDVPYMNTHLTIDQITKEVLLKAIRGSKAETVGGLISKLEEIEELGKPKTRIGPWMGESRDKLGNWALLFGAGTNGGYPVAMAYFGHGVDTAIYLHILNVELAKLKKDCKGNLVVLRHMAGDAIGANYFVSALGRHGVEVDTLDVVN